MNARTCTKVLTMALAALFLLTACAGGKPGKRELGGILGGVAGGVVGHQFGKGSGKAAATIAGVLLGAAVGSYIGDRMDELDRREMNDALETSRTGETHEWRNPDTGYEYEVQPTRTYQEPEGQYCREYTTSIFIDGKAETAHGTACRQSDGTWRIVDQY